MSAVVQTIKYGIEYGFNFSMLRKLQSAKDGKILLLLSPQYYNCGDHAIALSEMHNLEKLFPNRVLLDVNYSLFRYWEEKVRAAVAPGDTIVVTGGGFLGNLWPENHSLAERVIELFPENRIVFAPQTLFYRDTPTAQEEKQSFAKKLRAHGNFFFFGRDWQSCRQMEEMGFVRGEHFDYMPDFVLMLPAILNLQQKNGTPALCLRSDAEAVQNREAELRDILTLNGYEDPKSILMAKAHVEIPTWLRKQMLTGKLQEFADARFVITDRLHGMIFAAYTGTPCIAFDNVSKKISGVHAWMQDLPYISLAEDVSQVPRLLPGVLAHTKEENRRSFQKLQKTLSEEFLPQFAEQLK